MNKRLRRLGAFAAAAAMQLSVGGLALAQTAPPPSGPGGQPPGYAPGGQVPGGQIPGGQIPNSAQMVEPTPSTETTPGTELPVLYVTSVEVLRTTIDPKLDVVRVTGLTGSQGSASIQLGQAIAAQPVFQDKT